MKKLLPLLLFFILSFEAFSCATAARHLSRIEGSRRNAIRMAKRDAGIPMNQHPSKIESVPMRKPDYLGGGPVMVDGRRVMTREYHFTNTNGDKIVIQEHTAGHSFDGGGSKGPHFNVRPAHDTRHGTVPGTLAHYPVAVD